MLKTIENIIKFITEAGEYYDADVALLQLALKDLLDDSNIPDYLSVLDLIDAIVEDDDEAVAVLYSSIPVIDYQDDYDNSDVELFLDAIEAIKKVDSGSSKFFDSIAKALEQIGYSEDK